MKDFQENYFQQCFQAWQKYWNLCINTQGEYFEGEHTQKKFTDNIFFIRISLVI